MHIYAGYAAGDEARCAGLQAAGQVKMPSSKKTASPPPAPSHTLEHRTGKWAVLVALALHTRSAEQLFGGAAAAAR